MESPDLVWREGSNDRMQDASVVEKYEVLLRPVVWVDQLHWSTVRLAGVSVGDRYGPHLRIDCRALHLVEDVSDLFQIGDVSAVWIESSVPRRSFGEGIDEEFLNTKRMDLEMELIRDGV